MAKSKFEALFEHILNDDQEAANELFHNIVVEKSREIYNEIMSEEDLNEVNGEDQSDDFEQDINADHSGMDMHDVGADEGDMDTDEFGSDDADMGAEGEEEMEDRITDLESALDELKAEFDRLMGDEAEESEHADLDIEDTDHDGDLDIGADEGEDDVMSFDDDENMVREYIEKAPQPVKTENGVNTQSVVAKKNDMGGVAKNIAQASSNPSPDGTSAPKAPKAGDFTMGANDPRAAGKNAFDKAAPKPVSKEGSVNKVSPVAK